MKRLLALEWDAAEIRGVIGHIQARNMVAVDQAFIVPLAREGQGSDDAEIGPQLAAAVNMLGVGRMDAVVGVGRASIEMRQLQLPVAPDEDIPDMVRFQALRQFTAIGEDWPLDYVPLEQNDTAIQVLAAAISPQWVQQMVEACRAAHLTPKRLVLRPFAAASLLRRLPTAADSQVRLVVDILAADADLFVVSDNRVVFVRTVRLPSGEASGTSRAVALVGELRRTIAAAQSQLGGKRIDLIVVFGEAAQHAELLSLIDKQLNIPTQCVDPFAVAGTAGSHVGVAPDTSGRFAPLLGMLWDELTQTPPAMDFLHPRKRPERRSRRERLLLVATAVLAVLCLAAVTIKWQLDRLDHQIGQLNSQLKEAEKRIEAVKKREAELKQIEQFAESAVPWLDELRRLSLYYLPPREAVVSKWAATYQTGGEARLTLDGWVSDQRRLPDLESALRDEAHRVFGQNKGGKAGEGDLPWAYQELIVVDVKKLRSAEGASGTLVSKKLSSATVQSGSTVLPTLSTASEAGSETTDDSP